MKALLKMPLRLLRRLAAPVLRRIDQHLRRVYREGLSEQLSGQHGLLLQVQARLDSQDRALSEMSLCLDNLTRELARLQLHLEQDSPPRLGGEYRAAA